MAGKRWTITADKFLNQEQVVGLMRYLTERRDLAIARGSDKQSIRDYYIIRTLLESGLRVFEFCALVNSDVQGQKIIVKHGKGSKPRTVLLTRQTANMLKEWTVVKQKMNLSVASDEPLFPSRYGKRYTTRGIQKRVKTVFHVLGLPQSLSVHSLRHTYCSLLLSSGKVGIALVRANLGHHSISVTNLYAHAVGNLDGVELYSDSSSEKTEKCEPDNRFNSKKPSNLVKAFLRNTNSRRG